MQPYYADESVTLFHADCRELLPTLDRSVVSLLLTDPPYGIDIVNYSNAIGTDTISHAEVTGDREPFDPTPLLSYPKVILWGANHFADRLPPSSGWLVWDKREATPPNFMSDAELAWCSFKTPVRVFRHHWNGPVRKTERGSHLHPTQKPVALMRWVLDQWTQPDDLVLDPYMGSGPIAQACAERGRRYVGVEIEERYCEIAAKRLAQGRLGFGDAA